MLQDEPSEPDFVSRWRIVNTILIIIFILVNLAEVSSGMQLCGSSWFDRRDYNFFARQSFSLGFVLGLPVPGRLAVQQLAIKSVRPRVPPGLAVSSTGRITANLVRSADHPITRRSARSALESLVSLSCRSVRPPSIMSSSGNSGASSSSCRQDTGPTRPDADHLSSRACGSPSFRAWTCVLLPAAACDPRPRRRRRNQRTANLHFLTL